ncbi:hypothetical protein [Nocardia sp. NPDC006630]|uniref:hypothetical protein n=1 Tax=Nocardia sp. NPDC006630 TaxID=3157181 RepID=UPI0033B924D6
MGSVAWVPHCAGQLPCGVFELIFAGTSAQPFKYTEDFVTAGYGWPTTHGEGWGADPMVNYSAINKVPPLRSGQVTTGQTVHAFVAIMLGEETQWYVTVKDPDDVSNVEAGWAVHA